MKSFEERSTNTKFEMVQELLYWLWVILAVIIIVIGLVQALQSRNCPRLDLSRAEVVLRLRSSRGRKCLGFIGSIYLVADVALNIIFDGLIEALLKLIFDIVNGILQDFEDFAKNKLVLPAHFYMVKFYLIRKSRPR